MNALSTTVQHHFERRAFIRSGMIYFPFVFYLSGCNGSEATTSEWTRPKHYVLAFDTSKSDRMLLANFVKTGGKMAVQMDPILDRLTVWRVDRQTQEIPIGRPSKSKERFERQIIPFLRPLASNDYTLTDSFWSKSAVRAREGVGPFTIMFFTQGHTEGMTAGGHRLVQAAAKDLAKNPRVEAVCVIGAQPGTIESIRSDLKVLGNRLYIWSLVDAASEFKVLLAKTGGAK